jgi:hypothetical protein
MLGIFNVNIVSVVHKLEGVQMLVQIKIINCLFTY